MKKKENILFVCTGNICRSPMAEYLAREKLPVFWQTSSAGVFASHGMAASLPAVQVLAEKGIDLSPHRSRPVDPEMVDSSTLIVVMTASHRNQMSLMFPGTENKTFLLKSFDPQSDGGDLDDPVGLNVAVYRSVRDEIEAALPGLVAFAKNLELA